MHRVLAWTTDILGVQYLPELGSYSLLMDSLVGGPVMVFTAPSLRD